MSAGFYLMHRGWMDNPIFEDDQFSRAQAWEWLIHEASFEPHKIRFGNTLFEVPRGQVPTTYRKLMKKFRWGAGKTKAFISMLETESMITVNTERGFLSLTICNYDRYQATTQQQRNANGTQTEQERNKNGTNIKKGKELKETTDDDPRGDVEEIFRRLELIIQSPTPLTLAPITAWLSWGAIPGLDIYPVAERWKKKNPVRGMNSLVWLDEDIAKSITQRSKPMPVVEAAGAANKSPRVANVITLLPKKYRNEA